MSLDPEQEAMRQETLREQAHEREEDAREEFKTAARARRWVCKKYEQSKKQTPHVVAEETFNTEQEALEFYRRHKRVYGWPWVFWSYPEPKP